MDRHPLPEVVERLVAFVSNYRMRWGTFIAFLFLSASAHAGWFSYDNYEDCMLGRMKRQPQSMFYVADKACKKEFKVEFPISISKIQWTGPTIKIVDVDDEYVATKGTFAFSPKTCDESKDEDFSEIKEYVVVSGEAVLSPLHSLAMKCVRTKGLKGRYK